MWGLVLGVTIGTALSCARSKLRSEFKKYQYHSTELEKEKDKEIGA